MTMATIAGTAKTSRATGASSLMEYPALLTPTHILTSVAASHSTRKYLIVVATTVAAAPPIQRPSSRHTPRSKKPPKITFSVCIQKFSRKVLDLYEDSIRFPLGCLPNVQSVDLTRRRELKPEVCLKIAPSVRVECAGQIQPIVLDAVD